MTPNILASGAASRLGADRPARVLVIDPDASQANLLAEMAHDLGAVAIVGSGEEGLSAIKADAPDLVLLDDSLPGGASLDLCKTIKSRFANLDLPVLLVTGEPSVAIRAIEAGAADVLDKPLQRVVTRTRIKTQLTLLQRNDQLHRLAVVDGLTGIANRRAFDGLLEQECRRACRSGAVLSLLMIDVDYLKLFNDHYGHQEGDNCLRRVAGALAAAVRRPGETVARFGGEEFAIILPNCGREDALGLGEKARAAVESLAIAHGRSKVGPQVTVSIGVASVDFDFGEGGEGPVLVADALREAVLALLQTADSALYEAKRAGRNRVVWSEAPAS